MLLLLAFIFLKMCPHVYAQDSSWVYGSWRIEYMAFSSSPLPDELKHVVHVCRNARVVITASKLVFKGGRCDLLRSMNDFKITKQYTLHADDSEMNANYSTKATYYLFDEGRRKSIIACKTNYTFESDEGDVPELEIFVVDRYHLIINQDDTLLHLRRD